MMQRVITGAVLVSLLAAILLLGGTVVAIVAMAAICVAVYEEYHALAAAGHRLVDWPVCAAVLLAAPVLYLAGVGGVAMLLLLAVLATLAHVMFRADPRLEDALLSLLPLVHILLPGLCILSLARIESMPVQRLMLFLTAAIPVLGDTMAYFVGSHFRGPKLCPAVSPNKTITGALGGLAGSVLAAGVVGFIFYLGCGIGEGGMALPMWWQYALLGLVGGVASQLGDLFASLIKRHSGVKDYSNIFPGHGGMMDRLDSILFMAVVIACFRMLGM